MDSRRTERIPLQLSRSCVVASIQVDLEETVLRTFHTELLDLLQRSGARGVILDLSGVEVLDSVDFAALRRTMAMADLMGAKTVFAGFRPGVVSALVDLEADVCGIDAALNLDDAFRRMAAAKNDSGRALTHPPRTSGHGR